MLINLKITETHIWLDQIFYSLFKVDEWWFAILYVLQKLFIRVNGFLLNRLCHALLSGLKEVSYQNTKHINKNINQTQTNIKTQIKNI